MGRKSKYSADFRKLCIGDINGGGTLRAVASKYHIPPATLRHWYNAADKKGSVRKLKHGRPLDVGIQVQCVETGEVYPSEKVAAESNYVNIKCLGNAVRGKQKTCLGMHWRRYEAETD